MMEKTRILIVEDDPGRYQGFVVNLGRIDHAIAITDSAEIARDMLIDYNWDWLFLDHDLGGSFMSESDDNSGYAVALHLEEFPDDKPENVVIHSMNPTGADRMQAAINGSILLPNAWMYKLKEIEGYVKIGGMRNMQLRR
jgi:CheY-like chemotaxis protein